MNIENEIQHIHTMYDAMPTNNRIPLDYVRYNRHRSTFTDFLDTLFPPDTVSELCELYQIGGTHDGRTIFWQIDYCCQVRSGKIIAYGADGHRCKCGKQQGASWVHSLLIKERKLQEDFELQQCMFGENLLHLYLDKPVAICEAEKTAILCAAIYPQFAWIAAGGKHNFNADKCKALSLRDVIVFPDTDEDGSTYQLWKQKASSMRFMCRRIVVSDILERCATPEEKARKIDIADFLLKDYTGSHWTEQPPYRELNDTIMNMNKPF